MALFYTDSSGPNADARRAALEKLLDLALKRNPPVAIIAVYAKDNLDAYEGLLGSSVVRQLKKDWQVTVAGVTLHLYTEHGQKPLPAKAPVLAIDSSPALLERVIRDANALEVVYVPWTDAERDAFKAGNSSAECLYKRT